MSFQPIDARPAPKRVPVSPGRPRAVNPVRFAAVNKSSKTILLRIEPCTAAMVGLEVGQRAAVAAGRGMDHGKILIARTDDAQGVPCKLWGQSKDVLLVLQVGEIGMRSTETTVTADYEVTDAGLVITIPDELRAQEAAA